MPRRSLKGLVHATTAALAVCGLLTPLAARASSISSFGTVSAGVPLKVIKVDLNDLNVKVTGQMAQYGAGHSENFGKMVTRVQPTIAVTGTFFSNSSLIPAGDIVIDGKYCHFGGLGTALCITEDNTVEFVQPARYTHQDWSRYDFVLCCGPRLVRGGKAYVEPSSEGFHDKHMLNRNGRVAVGVTADNKLVFVATRKPVYLSKLARAMRALGVVDAINLDGGSSIGVYYRGKTLITPGRRLTNLILVYESREKYDAIKEQLIPVRMRSASR